MHAKLLAIIGIATLVLTTQADAKNRHLSLNHTQGAALNGFLDVAAIPAYGEAAPNHSDHRVARPMGRKHIAPSNGPDMALGSGVVRSGKTGATARVSAAHSAAFQAYIDDLEANGAIVKFMGGYRKGPCWSGGLHPCGKALDVCQTSRDVVDSRCHLPGRLAMIAIAAKHGLTEGGIWCHSDMGHVQTQMTAGPCGKNLYAAVGEFQARQKVRPASHRHHRRYAST